MAPFVPTLQGSGTPDYLSAARSPISKSDVYASVQTKTAPVISTPDTSLGKLFEGLGNLGVGAAKGADFAIQDKLKTEARAAIEPIRDAHGADLTPDETVPIAGTGARGSHYTAAAGIPGALDNLAPDTAPLPAGVSQNLSRVKKIQDAYASGNLSNSHYYAELQQVVQHLKTAYPGYEDQVDQVVSSITGVTPANALRSSILADMVSMSAAAHSQQNKMLTMYRQDQKYLPGVSFEDYSQNFGKYMGVVGATKANEFAIQSQNLKLENESKVGAVNAMRAGEAYSQSATNYVSTVMKGTLNQLQARAEKLVAQGPNANPQEMQQFLSAAAIVKQDMSSHLDQLATGPLNIGTDASGNPLPSNNSYVKFMKPDDIKQRKAAALEPVDTIIGLIGAKEFGPANAAANIAQWQTDQDFLKATRNIPAARAYKAFSKISPQFVGQMAMLSNGAGIEPMTKAVVDTGWLNVAYGADGAPPPSASTVISAAQGTHPRDPGKVGRTTVQGLQQMAASDDPNIAFRAVQSLYSDPVLFANTDSNEKLKLYTLLGNEDFTKKMVKLGEKNQQALQLYSHWMAQNFPVVAGAGISDLSTAVQYNKYKVAIDPDTWRFVITPTNAPQVDAATRELAATNPSVLGHVNQERRSAFAQAQSYADKINMSVSLIKPVLEAQWGKEQAVAQYMHLLQNAGVPFGQKKTGGFMDSISQAVNDWLTKDHPDINQEGVTSAKIKSGQITPEQILSIQVDDIPEGMSARDFIKKLQAK